MNIKKYISLEKLGLYNEKIKTLIDSKKNEAIESSNAYTDSIFNKSVVVYVGNGTSSNDTGNDNDIYINVG